MHRYDNKHSRGNKALFGAIIVVIGLALLIKKLGIIPYFDLHITWPVILIIIGFFIGIKNGFRNNAPFVLIAIGVFNLIPATPSRISRNGKSQSSLDPFSFFSKSIRLLRKL